MSTRLLAGESLAMVAPFLCNIPGRARALLPALDPDTAGRVPLLPHVLLAALRLLIGVQRPLVSGVPPLSRTVALVPGLQDGDLTPC